MRSKLALSAAVASLLFAAPVFAAETPPAAAQECRGERKHHGYKRMEHRFDRAVEEGRLTREQADQFAAEARQLREEVRAQREANGGRLTAEQKEQFKQRRQAFRQKVHAAMKAPAAQGA